MNDYNNLLDLGVNDLIKAEHLEYGTFYFTSIYRFSKAINEPIPLIKYHISKHNTFKGWMFDVVDGSDIPYGQINTIMLPCYVYKY